MLKLTVCVTCEAHVLSQIPCTNTTIIRTASAVATPSCVHASMIYKVTTYMTLLMLFKRIKLCQPETGRYQIRLTLMLSADAEYPY